VRRYLHRLRVLRAVGATKAVAVPVMLVFRRGLSLALSLDLVGVLELPAHTEFAVDERDTGKLVDGDAYVEEGVSGEKMVQLRPQASRVRGRAFWVGVVGHEEPMSAQFSSAGVISGGEPNEEGNQNNLA